LIGAHSVIALNSTSFYVIDVFRLAEEERKRQRREKMDERRRTLEAKRMERAVEVKANRRLSDMTVTTEAEADVDSFSDARLALVEDVEVDAEVDAEDSPDWTDWDQPSAEQANAVVAAVLATPTIISSETAENTRVMEATSPKFIKTAEVAPLG
jgi:hypothetical protein